MRKNESEIINRDQENNRKTAVFFKIKITKPATLRKRRRSNK